MDTGKTILTYENAIRLLIALPDFNLPAVTDFKKNTITFYDTEDQKQIKYRYPLILNLSQSIIKDVHLLNKYIMEKPSFALLLIQAGHAALGVYQGDTLTHHKVIQKYMTRKKQGKTQLKYLKTRGKSRAGSRIRLANSVLFFEEINRYMNQWKIDRDISIIYSCSPMLWGMLFQSKTAVPFERKELRLKKLPLSLDVPNFEILKKVARFSQTGFIDFDKQCREEIRQPFLDILKKISS